MTFKKGHIPWNKNIPRSEETKQKIRDTLRINNSVSGINNPNYRHGRCICNYCIDCNTKIDKQATRCQPCFHKLKLGKNNPNYIDGRTTRLNYCVDCNKLIGYQATRCRNCNNNYIKLKGLRKGNKNSHFGKKAVHGKKIKYKNIYMRSSWEVGFAKWLDAFDINWQYESKTFNLGNYTYTPDFYLPDFNYYIEIKGWLTNISKIKLNLFKKQYPDIKLKILRKEDLKFLNIL